MALALALLPDRRYGELLAVLILMILNGNASGQESDVGDNSNRLESRNGFDEIIVTAQKREQPLQLVAASVTALSAELVKNAGIKDVSDLGLYTPGLVVSTNGTAGRVYIRGVGNNLDFLGSQGAVAVHVDGVYQSRPWGVFYDFIDVERIEVLRGPQGTIYGRNATGGAINVISAAPTEELMARASMSVGNFDEVKLEGWVSSAITDGVTGRLMVSRKLRDGFTKNLVPGSERLGDEDLVSTRGELQMSPSDNVQLRLLGRYFSRDTEGQAIVPTTDGLAATLGARSNTDPFEVSHNIDTFFEADNYELAAIATWSISADLALESTTAYGENTVDYHLDTDGTEVDAVHFQNREDHEQFSQELRLYNNAGSSQWAWQAGLYYLTERTSDIGVVFIPAIGADIPVSGEVDVDAFALFAQGTYELTERLGLTVGLRYNTESKSMRSPALVDDRASWNDWTPHVSLGYRLSDDAFIYGSITKGFKSGGYNVLGGGERVGPEYVWSYELGSKADWFDHRVRLNAAMFYSRYDDQQVNTFTGAGLARIDNAAKSTIYGIELEAFAAPTDVTNIGVTVSYLNAKFDQYLAADPFLGAVDLAGSRLSNAPKYSVTFSGDYTLPLKTQATITVHLDYLWQDDVKYDVFDNASTNQAAYGIVNAGVWYTEPERNWKVGLWIRNLTDQNHFTSHAKLNFTPEGTLSFTGKPRTYGLELSFNY